MQYKIAILGGMGPLATVKAYEMIVKLTLARSDNEHIPVLVFGDSQIPDRTAAICEGGESPVSEVKKNLEVIDKLGIREVMIPCNTCHFFYDELQEHTGAEIINMVEVTSRYVIDNYGDRECYVLGTAGTYQGKVYERYLGNMEGYKTMSAENQDFLMDLIYRIKESGTDDAVRDSFSAFINEKASSNGAVFILGCTELSLLKDEVEHHFENVIFVDAMEVAACAAILKAGYRVDAQMTSLNVESIKA